MFSFIIERQKSTAKYLALNINWIVSKNLNWHSLVFKFCCAGPLTKGYVLRNIYIHFLVKINIYSEKDYWLYTSSVYLTVYSYMSVYIKLYVKRVVQVLIFICKIWQQIILLKYSRIIPLFVILRIIRNFFSCNQILSNCKEPAKTFHKGLVFKYIRTVTWEKSIHNNNTLSLRRGHHNFSLDRGKENVYCDVQWIRQVPMLYLHFSC